ncbi:NmrA-domain-containing protein [Eremomyces bilateralis CBS 781.70]|uniref:NmrA-domain-containing protein n=1 Tax=Eremomyces bilateralis CBS 781.70 TaxID=1392243 RepID=A0A6G1G7K4_9PEZI|nr:NmrA-domain-containing protein [Eremomyces bilateralis CBS 781.70]KAF1813911.1 NmrA-domain-containing protein [Eremomyces bilateralis CBS 781.70]
MRTGKTLVTINSSGRQAASVVRVAAAIGWNVRAQMRDRKGIVAQEICSLPNVTVIEGDLEEPGVIAELFSTENGGVDLAFINTTHWGNEFAVGKALADEAKRVGVKHYIYSTMPDHSRFRKGWKSLPLWARKAEIEEYVKKLGLRATFVYTAIYHNNFTSLDYPLFRMELLDDGSFEWRAPFHEHDKLPWLDAEHDVGPAILQIFKHGPQRWHGERVCLAFQNLTPLEVCRDFSRALNRPVHYVRAPITISLPVPTGYREHLEILEEVLGNQRAPYFGPDLQEKCLEEALELWEGFRSMEEYAREVFPLEEAANGLRWMEEDGREFLS